VYSETWRTNFSSSGIRANELNREFKELVMKKFKRKFKEVKDI